MRHLRLVTVIAALSLIMLLAACRDTPPATPTTPAVTLSPVEENEPAATPTTVATPPTAISSPTSEPAVEPTAESTSVPDSPDLPPAIEYDLGEATIIQEGFPEDSRFRDMPVRLNGVMAIPQNDERPFPVVVILHGTHPGCPVDEMGVDRWPCDPESEQANYRGFEYLVREMAARGYMALSININAQNTFGFGEPVGGERLVQILDRHLSALAEAALGQESGFGVDLSGVPDLSRLVFFGHSRGGEAANWLASDVVDSPNLSSPITAAESGYGPVRGLLLIAPAVSVFGAAQVDVPQATILPSCDGDVVDLNGQLFFDRARFATDNALNTSVILERANHNGFNSNLGGDIGGTMGRPDCEVLLDPEAQRQFLVDYAADFLVGLFETDPEMKLAALARLGLDAGAVVPSEILELSARVSVLGAAADRMAVFIPEDEAGLSTNTLGGEIVAEGAATHFCPEGYFIAEENPGADPCRRPTVTVPGYPAMAVVSWKEPTASIRFALPEGSRDLSRFTALSLRSAIDPLSPLNAPNMAQAFSVWLTDGTSNSAVVATPPDEPALRYPAGLISEDAFFGDTFIGLSPLATIRLPLTQFAGVDLSNVTEIALVFDQSASGTLFIGDLELIQ